MMLYLRAIINTPAFSSRRKPRIAQGESSRQIVKRGMAASKRGFHLQPAKSFIRQELIRQNRRHA
jgi:hypothetical protein